MTTMLRVFIKPDGHLWVDMALADGQHAGTVFSSAAREGHIVCTEWFVPMDAVLFCATWTMTQPQPQPASTVVPFKPSQNPPWLNPLQPSPSALVPDPSQLPPDKPT